MAKARISKGETKNNKKLVLLDAHAIIHRAYHALPEFVSSKGEPTGALYGLSAILIKFLGDLKPDYVVAAFDLPGPTHRHESYAEYKAGRVAADDALILQLERAKDLFAAWGIPAYMCPGFEADDVIGTVVSDLKKEKNTEIIIASGDMDTLQLVDGKKVRVYTMKKGLSETVLYDEEKVKERFGFPPELLPDYKGLRGDPSDNIKGVKGIGEKTATTLIGEFGSVENVYKTLKKSPEKVRVLGLTERMTNILIENEEEALFSKTLATIRKDAPVNFTLPAPWQECLDMEKLSTFFHELEFRTMPDRVRALLGKSDTGAKEFRPSEVVPGEGIKAKEAVRHEPTREEKELCLALWVIDTNLANPSMDDVLHFTKTKDLKEARKILEREMDERGVRKVFEEIECPLLPVIEKMNRTGVRIDRKILGALSADYHKKLDALEKGIWREAGEEFNINSPKQLGEIIFKKLALAETRQKKTPGGALSTKESELVKLVDKHAIIPKILEYRELQKLLSTYIDTIPKLLDKDSRLHSEFQQAGTTTGRLSSTNPNLQNIPIKSELGRAIRRAFIAEEGFSLVALDYSQIELRIAAMLSGDKKLIEIFKNGEDVHTGVAMRVFGVPAEKVDKAMRIKAKTINFGILFGMGVNALKVNLGTDRKEAQEFYNQYFNTFKELAEYLDGVKAEAERTGYTETMFGRKRYFTGFRSPLPYVRAQAERMAINAPIQGTEADLLKIAMCRINDLTRDKHKEDIRLILQVHDELVYEVRDDLVDEAVVSFKGIMENVLPKNKTRGVPVIVDTQAGKNWGEMIKK